MRNIVLDTNCLLVCLASGSKFHVVWTAFLNEDYRLCISNEIITEYEEILGKNKFVDCAIVADADYIVSNDKHFNVLKPFPPIKVIDIEAFKDVLMLL